MPNKYEQPEHVLSDNVKEKRKIKIVSVNHYTYYSSLILYSNQKHGSTIQQHNSVVHFAFSFLDSYKVTEAYII